MNTINWTRILKTVPDHMHKLVKRVIPPLSPHFHKGQAGRICVIGGCLEYTGAPFYASDAALKCGADMSFIICTHSAATAIKSYSPELIVYPYLPAENEHRKNEHREEEKQRMMDKSVESIQGLLSRVHAVVIGPGLGRDDLTVQVIVRVIPLIREKGLPIILDGDGLWLVSQHIDLIHGYDRAILTPNPVEFKRLGRSVFPSEEHIEKIRENGGEKQVMVQLCEKLGNVTIVRKGKADMICNGVSLDPDRDDATVLECAINGEMNRRPGGQGDILAGTCGTFSHWAMWAASGRNVRMPWHRDGGTSDDSDKRHLGRCLLVGMYGATLLSKCAGYSAFMDLHRGMTTPNMLERIPFTFQQIYPMDECGGDAGSSN